MINYFLLYIYECCPGANFRHCHRWRIIEVDCRYVLSSILRLRFAKRHSSSATVHYNATHFTDPDEDRSLILDEAYYLAIEGRRTV